MCVRAHVCVVCLTHLSVVGTWSRFCIPTITNSTAGNRVVPVCFRMSVFIFLREIPRSGMAGSCGPSPFTSLRHLCAVFHSSCANLQSHGHSATTPLAPHPRQPLLPAQSVLEACRLGFRGQVLTQGTEAETGRSVRVHDSVCVSRAARPPNSQPRTRRQREVSVSATLIFSPLAIAACRCMFVCFIAEE